MTIRERIALVLELELKLVSHHMCYNYRWEGTSLIVYLPLGFRYDMVRVADSGKGKADTLTRMIDIIDKEWEY